MDVTTKYVLLCMLSCKIGLALSLRHNFCNGVANFIALDQWSPVMNYESLLNFTEAFPQLVTEENFLHSSIEVLTDELEKWKNATPTLELPGATHLANSGVYRIMQSKPIDAESNCTRSNGVLPILQLDEDEHIGLGELMSRKNVNQTVIRAFPERSGYYTGTGFFVGEFTDGPLPGYRFLNQTEDINEDMNKVLGDPRGPMIAKLGPNKTAVLTSLEDEERDDVIDFLCRVEGNSCFRSKAERDACIYQGSKVIDILGEYYAFVKGIRQGLTASKTTDGESDIQLATAPSNTTTLQIKMIETGVSTFRHLLVKLAAEPFYHDTRLDFATVLLNMRVVIENTFKEVTLEEDKDTFAIQLTTESLSHLSDNSRVRRDVAGTLVKWAGAFILKPFKDLVILAALKVIEKISPTTLFAIRSFLNSDNMVISDRFLLDDGQKAYTTYNRPEVVGCNTIQGVKACDSYGIETDGVLDYSCGERLVGRQATGKCPMTYPKDRFEMIPRVACPLQSSSHQGLLNDVIVSDREAAVTKDCGKGGATQITLKEGSNAFDATQNAGCDFKIDNKIIFHSPDYSSNNIPNLTPESTLTQGKTVAVSDHEYETPLGDFEFWQLVALSAIILTLSATALLAIAVACNPRWRLEFLRNWCCCFLRNGWRNWVRNSRLYNFFCNCRIYHANSWDPIPGEEQEPNVLLELQEIEPPAVINEGPIGLACAPSASISRPNVGPSVSFEPQTFNISDLRQALSYLSSDARPSTVGNFGNRRDVARILGDMYQVLNPQENSDDVYGAAARCISDVNEIVVTPMESQNQPRASRARNGTNPAQGPQRPQRRTRSQPPPSYDDLPVRQQAHAQLVDSKTGARSKTLK